MYVSGPERLHIASSYHVAQHLCQRSHPSNARLEGAASPRCFGRTAVAKNCVRKKSVAHRFYVLGASAQANSTRTYMQLNLHKTKGAPTLPPMYHELGYQLFTQNEVKISSVTVISLWRRGLVVMRAASCRTISGYLSSFRLMVSVNEAVSRGLSQSLGLGLEDLPALCQGGETISLLRVFHYFPYTNDGAGVNSSSSSRSGGKSGCEESSENTTSRGRGKANDAEEPGSGRGEGRSSGSATGSTVSAPASLFGSVQAIFVFVTHNA